MTEYKPEKDRSGGRLTDRRINEIIRSAILTPQQPEPMTIAEIDNQWMKATGKKSRSMLISGLPHIENNDFNTKGIPLSAEGQARVIKETRAYKDAVIRYQKAVPAHVSDLFLRTNPTLEQLKAAARVINGNELEAINKKWRSTTTGLRTRSK